MIEFQTDEFPTLWAIFNQAYPELSGPVQIDDKSEIQTNNLISDNVNTHEFLTGKLKKIIPARKVDFFPVIIINQGTIKIHSG